MASLSIKFEMNFPQNFESIIHCLLTLKTDTEKSDASNILVYLCHCFYFSGRFYQFFFIPGVLKFQHRVLMGFK